MNERNISQIVTGDNSRFFKHILERGSGYKIISLLDVKENMTSSAIVHKVLCLID
jgi:hypothetical protein